MRARILRVVPIIASCVTGTVAFAVHSFAGEVAAKNARSADSVVGEYVEARTCDVWTGPCFANGEINLKGDHAVMAWIVRQGRFEGVRIDGLNVAAVVDSEGTLGTDSEGRVRAILYVDAKASEVQQKALISMAKGLAPRLLKNIVRVERRAIAFRIEAHCKSRLRIAAKQGDVPEVTIETVPLNSHCDVVCGNEEKAYPTLAETVASMCAKTRAHAFRGVGLGVRWSDPGARSAMLGRFRI